MQAEHSLNSSDLSPDMITSSNSPVLGIPVALFRLSIQAKQVFQQPEIQKIYMLKLQEEFLV